MLELLNPPCLTGEEETRWAELMYDDHPNRGLLLLSFPKSPISRCTANFCVVQVSTHKEINTGRADTWAFSPRSLTSLGSKETFQGEGQEGVEVKSEGVRQSLASVFSLPCV